MGQIARALPGNGAASAGETAISLNAAVFWMVRVERWSDQEGQLGDIRRDGNGWEDAFFACNGNEAQRHARHRWCGEQKCARSLRSTMVADVQTADGQTADGRMADEMLGGCMRSGRSHVTGIRRARPRKGGMGGSERKEARRPHCSLDDMHTSTNPPWTAPRPPSAAYWRPPTATGLHRPEPTSYRPPPPGHAPPRTQTTAWRQAQEEARYVIKVEQERLDRLFAAESENLRRAEDALAGRRRSGDEHDYDRRLLADEERRVALERSRIGKLRADNTEWLSHLIKQETDRIHAAMIEDELAGRLTPEESDWLDQNIQRRKADEQRQSLKRAQEEEAARARRLEEEEEAAKLRAAQAEELAQAARLERFALPPIPDPDALALVDLSDDKALARVPKPPPRRNSSASADMSSASDDTATLTAEAARRAWANNLKSEWERRGAHEEHHVPRAQRTPSFSYRYRPASQENMAAARRAEELRRYHEHQEEIKYRERQAARAAREAREAAAARKAFDEERRRLDDERRRKEDERRKNEEQVVVAAWQRYERGWQDLLNGVTVDGRQLTFYDIPWPVAMPARSFEELQSAAIEKFLLSPHHSSTKTRKMRLRAALMQWHPDKFAQRFVDRIEESHRNAILAAVNSVARTITELMNDSD
ncbi:hypothetical protein CTheo_5326 [Ceratobasidium theobromae]|uniref:Uncharacterized protein n=1 Tax=Ceratobasidium theobromae TaxID=1582974 RepID=A0A5N5QHV8_9AGAM|nr:hypothetical protein CTheo_5326 [Ceratobasidium theobromae]